MLAGEARAFYYPPGTLYATAFDEHPLAAMAREGRSPRQIMDEIRRRGVRFLWFNWAEILRLANTYGYEPLLVEGLAGRLARGEPPGLDLLDRLQAQGLTVQLQLPPQRGDAWPANLPLVTVYAVPR